MKYTKYQYKKKSNGIKFLSSLVMTTVLAISIGVFVAWMLLKVIPYDNILGKINDVTPIDENNDEQTMGETLIKNISVIQCGYFSKEDNAKQVLAKIDNSLSPFIVQDSEGKFRVIAGISKEDESNNITDKLKQTGVENIKVNLSLNENNKVEEQILEITNGYLEILNTASQDEVKEIKTNDFKTWASNLEDINEGDYFEVLKEYKEHISALEENITKENTIKELEFIYSILNKIKK